MRESRSIMLFVGAVLLALGSFAGEARACITSESERNDRDNQADGPVCSGVAISGEISSRRDQDWFYFEVGGSGEIAISLDHATNDDFDWFLYRETGGSIASGATSQVPETGTFQATGAETYYLEIVQYSGSGWYTLDITFPEDGGGDPGGDPGGTGCDYGPRPSAPGGLKLWLTGSGDDACTDLSAGPGLLLMGGNYEVDEAFVQRASPVIGMGDVVVIRTSGSDGYNDYLYSLIAPDSVETLKVDRRSHADSDYVDWVVRSAEMVWMAGGDQSDYLNNWQGTRLEDAIRHVYEKGGVVGGLSAGLAVLGEVIYDPDGILSVYSEEAVTDPCHAYVNLSTDFLGLTQMTGIVTDSHFYERDRMGRLLAFMARIGDPGLAPTVSPITGIGIDEDTSLWIDAQSQAVADGVGAVYVLREGAQTVRTQVTCGQPVIYDGVERYRLFDGDTFDFTNGTSSVAPLLIGIDGRFGNFYSPSDPY